MRPAMTECISQQELFSIGRRKVTARSGDEQLSAEAGALLLSRLDRRHGISSEIASILSDDRDPSRVKHTMEELIRQRLIQICCGYEDCNDADSLRHDPLLQLACGRLPQSEDAALGSQPTLSRNEKRAPEENAGLGRLLTEKWIRRQKRKAIRRIVTFDFDSTNDPTHGDQQMSMFHGYYDQYMYHPLLAFDEEGFPVVARLRAGRASDKEGMIDEMLRIGERISEDLGRSVKVRVRADAGFQDPETYDLLETAEVDYAIGLNTYVFLKDKVADEIRAAEEHYAKTKRKRRHYTELTHKAQTWSRPRRVIVMIECDGQGTNVRFVVTTLQSSPKSVYKFYCGRGQSENYIKELKNAMFADRLSCHLFESNQFRLYLHTFAYLLMFFLREQIEDPELRSAQMDTLRLRLLKIAVRVRVTARRIWLDISAAHPRANLWMNLAGLLHAPPA